MKSLQNLTSGGDHRRGGAVIILSLAFLMTLLFLGLFFFSFIDDESRSAEIFSQAERATLDHERIMEFGLKQVIVATERDFERSALFGNRWSMLAHVLGQLDEDGKPLDSRPFSGRGITVRPGMTAGTFEIDYDGDGAVDQNESNFVINFSADANDGEAVEVWTEAPYDQHQPDAGYTYPDLNALFLAYEEFSPDGSLPIIKPSFFLPGLFPDKRTSGFADIFEDTMTKAQVLRPHAEHGNRYIPEGATVEARSGDFIRRIPGFEFGVDFDGDGNVNEMGVYDGSDSYDFDVDADGDGYADSILVDLDARLIDHPDGRQLIPLYFFKILDANGLLPLNTSGNTKPPSNMAVNWTTSRSNFGLSLAEINPGWGWYASPYDTNFTSSGERDAVIEAAFGAGTTFLATAGKDARLEASNRTLRLLLEGKLDSMSEPEVYGRWTTSATDMLPGTQTHDDDYDNAGIGATRGVNRRGAPYTNATLGGVEYPGAVHPIDWSGKGTWLSGIPMFGDTAFQGATRLRTAPVAEHPVDWVRYDAFADLGAGTGTVYPSHRVWGDIPALTTNPDPDQLVDEPDETIVDPWVATELGEDSIFLPGELAAIHLSDADWHRVGRSSRVRELLKYQFELNFHAEQIRRQYSTTNWDRKEFAHALTAGRQWEFEGGNEFPPSFVGPDPFRWEVRELLRVVLGSPGPGGFQQRLRLNEILSDDDNDMDISSNGLLEFRPLTPHPEFDGGTPVVIDPMIHNGSPTPTFPPTTLEEQEWWARYDRQRLARDIYVLLYVLGSHEDSLDLTANPYPVSGNDPVTGLPYDDDGNGVNDMVEAMAQFAVNVVDALDRDNVITRFDYDPDLSDGWDDTHVSSGGQLRTVNGVEAVPLTLSEGLVIRLPEQSSDVSETFWEDDAEDGHALFWLELRNSSPFPIELKDDTWRLVRLDGAGANNPAVTFKSSMTTDNTIGAGETFLIGGQSNTMKVSGNDRASTLYVDYDSASSGFEAIVPYGLENGDSGLPTDASSGHPEPLVDLDLSYTGPNDHQDRFEITNPSGGTGTLVSIADVPGTDVTFSLQRRRHLQNGGGVLSQAEDDWIEVDRIRVPVNQFPQPDMMMTTPTLTESLIAATKSMERPEPFHPVEMPHEDGTDADPRSHSLGDPTDPHKKNDTFGGTTFTLWQPHFDRDFTSPMELLSVPVYGHPLEPDDYDDTDELLRAKYGGPVKNLAEDVGGTMRMTGHRTAGALFRNSATNRWYRLLEFFELEPSFHQPTGDETDRRDALAQRRQIPSGVNLNTIRHPTVLAGVVDDPHHLDPFENFANVFSDPDPHLPGQDRTEAAVRNWYTQFKRARDGVDAGGNLQPPGTEYARPFRPMTYIDPTSPETSIYNTLLRNHVGTGTDLDQLGLFEARTTADVGNESVDYHTRNRLLAKVANLTTNRSHVFVMWAGFQFHEAHIATEDVNNNGVLDPGEDLNMNGELDSWVQVGAHALDVPGHRAFLVIDMSRLEEAWDPTTLTFNFEGFVVHREVLP